MTQVLTHRCDAPDCEAVVGEGGDLWEVTRVSYNRAFSREIHHACSESCERRLLASLGGALEPAATRSLIAAARRCAGPSRDEVEDLGALLDGEVTRLAVALRVTPSDLRSLRERFEADLAALRVALAVPEQSTVQDCASAALVLRNDLSWAQADAAATVKEGRSALAVAVAVTNETGDRLLLVHHRERGWELPGGHVEAGETWAGAAAREVGEEAGLGVTLRGGASMLLADQEGPVVLLARAAAQEDPPLPRDPDGAIIEAAWFRREEVTALVLSSLSSASVVRRWARGAEPCGHVEGCVRELLGIPAGEQAWERALAARVDGTHRWEVWPEDVAEVCYPKRRYPVPTDCEAMAREFHAAMGQDTTGSNGADPFCCDPVTGAGGEELPDRDHVLTDREAMVREFHAAMGQDAPASPAVPSDDVVRLRLRLVAEEFFELLDASVGTGFRLFYRPLYEVRDGIMQALCAAPLRVSLSELVDATVDLDYVVEGTRVAFGVKSGGVWPLVHAANMAKFGGARREDGKVLKPEGWRPPDVAGELARQGWSGSRSRERGGDA